MPGKRDANTRYDVHGRGTESLGKAFDHIGMPEHRRAVAVEIVSEILAANDAADFYWYLPPATEEVCCYWDDAEQNQLWINPGEIHVPSDETHVRRPTRALTYSKQNGDYVGWLLPGGQLGTGGGPPKASVPEVLCPATFIRVPAGRPCSYCEVEHSVADATE